MGSGRGGLHKGTWGSREGEELRSRVDAAFEEFGGSVAGDAAAGLAEALVRIAMGGSPEEAVPEPGEVAFDLALDALSPFVRGGGRVTRELAIAAKVSRGVKADKVVEEASRAAKRAEGLLKDETGYIRLPARIRMSVAEYASVNTALNTMYHVRLAGKSRIDVTIGDCRYGVLIHDFDEYTIITRKRIIA